MKAIFMPTRQEAIYHATIAIQAEEGADLYTKAKNYIKKYKEIPNPHNPGDPGYDPNYEPYMLSTTEQGVLAAALSQLASAPALSDMTLPSLKVLPDDTSVPQKLQIIWNDIIGAWFNQHMAPETQAFKDRLNVGAAAPAPDTLESRLYQLLRNYQVQGNMFVYDSSGAIIKEHPLSKLGAEISSSPLIGKSLVKHLWCHQECRDRAIAMS